MLERLISSVLNRTLGTFIENLDAEQLKINIWNSNVKLENLQIKTTIFDSMPVPFTLHYGKVGKIFIDIPILTINTSPLKIEISDVFMFIKPKHFNNWIEKVEIDAFINNTFNSLEKYEDYITETTQLEQQQPGMIPNLISKIVDNIQLKITNIYIRIEDTLSIPRLPFALGIVIGSIQAETMNEKWQPQFIAGADITNKEFSIKDFAVYMNFSENKAPLGSGKVWTERDILFDDITKDWREKDFDQKYMKFLKKECEFQSAESNNYIIERFGLTLRAQINKNVRNRKPQVWANMVLGGEFKGVDHAIVSDYGQYFYFSIQQQQITCLVKLLEYIGNYGKFQAGVVSKLYKNEMTPQQESDYTALYLRFKACLAQKLAKEAEDLKLELRDKFEKSFTYEKLVVMRTIATKRFEHEQLQKLEKSKVAAKIKEYEAQKSGGYFSGLKGMLGLGKKTVEEEEEEKKQKEEMKQHLEKEALEKIAKSNQQLVQQISLLKTTGKVQDSQLSVEFLELMGTDWIQIEARIIIPEVHFVLRRADNCRLLEIKIHRMQSVTNKGLDYIDTSFTLHTFNIKDHTFKLLNPEVKNEAPYPFILETYIPNSDFDQSKNALNLRFVQNPRIARSKKEGACCMKLTLSSDSQLFIFANFACINEVKDMVVKAFAESQNSMELVEYYKGVASEQLFKYVNEGSELMLNLQEDQQQQTKKSHTAIMLDIQLNAPVLFIPERYDTVQGNQLLVLDMGNINIDSKLIDFDPNLNYKLINNPMMLYDAYNFLLKDMQIMGFQYLEDYRYYASEDIQITQYSFKLLKDVSLKMNFYNCIEQKHPASPNYEISVSLETMTVTASDYVFKSLLTLKDKVLEKMNPPEPEAATRRGTNATRATAAKSFLTQREAKPSTRPGIIIEEAKESEAMSLLESIAEEEKKQPQFQFDMDPKTMGRRQSRRLSNADIRQQTAANIAKKLSDRKQAADGVSMNVIVKIGQLELDINEQIEMGDADFNPRGQKDILQHRALMKIRMTDLILNYFLNRQGIMTINLILTHFDIIDRVMIQDKFGRKAPMIPEIFAQIISNPEAQLQREMVDEGQYQEEEKKQDQSRIKSLDRELRGLRTKAGGAKSPGQYTPLRTQSRRAESGKVSEASADFKSCYSITSSISLNVQEILDSQTQMYSKIVIEQKDADTQKIDIDFFFSELQIVVSLPSLEKMLRFSKKLTPPQAEQEIEDDLFSRQMTLYRLGEQSRRSRMTLRANSNVMMQNASQAFNEKFNRFTNRISRNLIEEEPEPSQVLEKRRKIRFMGRFKNIKLWIPLDSRQKYSRVFSFSLMSQINFRRDELTLDTVDTQTGQLLFSISSDVRDEAIITINQLQILMLNRHLLNGKFRQQDGTPFGRDRMSDELLSEMGEDLMTEIERIEEVTIEKLLEPSRVTIKYENTSKEEGLKTSMMADVLVEPFEIKVGFREVEFFNKLNKNLQSFLEVLQEDSKSHEGTVSDLISETELDLDKKLSQYRRKELKDLEDFKKSGDPNETSSQRVQIKNKEQVQTQTIKFICETFRMSLMDDTGLQEFPVIFMNVKNIRLDRRMYEDVDDAAVFILKKMGILKKKSDEEEPYQSTKASLCLEIQYFNMNVQQYEPFLEPWVLELSQLQEEKYIGEITTVSSPQMLNLNVTFSLMENLIKIQRYMSESSEDWSEEQAAASHSNKKRAAIEVASEQNTSRKGKHLRPLIEEEGENQSGFIFINRLGLPCSFMVEGQDLAHMQQKLVDGLLNTNKQKGAKLQPTLDDLQTQLKNVDEKNPKAHFIKLGLLRQINIKKRERNQVEEVTELDVGSQRFRKGDELFYLLKQIKKTGKSQSSHNSEDILRIDLTLDSSERIKAIPIELGGVRSFVLNTKEEGDETLLEEGEVDDSFVEKKKSTATKRKKKKGDATGEHRPKMPVAVICKVKFVSQLKKEVEFQSSLLISNSSQHDIMIVAKEDGESGALKEIKKAQKRQVGEELSTVSQQKVVMESNVKDQVVIQSGKVFYVPLTWFLEERAIYVQKADGNYHELFPNIREYFQPNLDNYDYMEPQNIEIYNELHDQSQYVSVNVALFKCKPTNLKVPGQFLVTFTPPICVSNYLFADLFLLRGQNEDAFAFTESKGFFYLDNMKFEPMENGLGSRDMIRWKMADDKNGFYMSIEPQPFFIPKKQKNSQSQYSQLRLAPFNKFAVSDRNGLGINNSISSSVANINQHTEEQKDDHESAADDCIINLELLPFNVINNEYENFELRDKVMEKTAAVMLQVYPQVMIVNQTDIEIFVKTQVDGPTTGSKDRIVAVKAHDNEFFYSSSFKAQVKVAGYQWSKVFDGTTQGLSGLVEVKTMSDDNSTKEKFLNFGIIFQNGSGSYSRTKIIKIVPRYIIYNALDDDILVKQKGLSRQVLVPASDRTKVYNFQNKEKDPFIQIGDVGLDLSIFEEEEKKQQNLIVENDDEKWSSSFSIEDIGDFQVEFQSRIDEAVMMNRMTLNQSKRQQTVGGKSYRVWHMPNDSNFHKRIVRVVITTQDDASIFIKICKPKFPEYYLHNDTEVGVNFSQFNCLSFAPRTLLPGKKVPFVWFDQTQAVKKLALRMETCDCKLSIDKIHNKEVIAGNDTYYINVMTTGEVRTVEIKSKSALAKRKKPKEKGSSILAKMMLSSMMKKESKFRVEMKGLGVSLIDNEPKEVLFLSVYKLSFLVEKWTEQQSKRDELDDVEVEKINEVITKYDLKIDHIQIDNMISNLMPVLFCPVKELHKDEEGVAQLKEDEEYTPFIQAMITFSEIHDQDIFIRKYRGLQVSIQEMKLQVETGFINSLLRFTEQILAVQNQNLGGNQAIGFQSKQQQVKMKTFKTHRSSSIMSSKQQVALPKNQVCELLSAGLPEILPELKRQSERKIFFELIHIGAVKVRITTRFEKQALALGNLSQGLVVAGLLQIVFTTVATISDSPLSFKELVIVNIYSTTSNLIMTLTKNYTRQGVLQFYKLIGSSDLLGNPVGLIDKLGTGVFEFFNEPRKGLLKGPKEFVGGVGKGVKSLLTNVVSGSFDSVSKITGSLYGVLKNVSGNTVNEQEMALKKPEHAFDGIYLGLKGGATELAEGVTGLFTKPFKRAKEEGAVGFFKGLGAGAIGLVASPFAATLRLGNNLATGIKNSAIRIGKGKIPTYGRFRHPRYFNSKNILQPYDEVLAEANEILKTVKSGRFASSSILHLADFSASKRGTSGLVIITDTYILYVEDCKHVRFKCPVRSVIRCEVYEERSTQEKQKKEDARQIVGVMQHGEDEEEKKEVMQKDKRKKVKEGGKMVYKYWLLVECNKRGRVSGAMRTRTLKLVTENYPDIDKIYSLISL